MRWQAAILLAACVAVGCTKESDSSKVVLEPPGICAAVREARARILQIERQAGGSVRSKALDVRGLSAKAFRKELESFPGGEVHLWMPGEKDWLLVGRDATNKVSLAKAMNDFADDTNCTMSVAEAFASYAGTRDDILPAFKIPLKGDVLPEWFVTKEIPSLDWLDVSGIDGDILRPILSEVRSMQVVRRELLKGNMLAAKATDKKGEEEAAAAWARAALRNPNDPMLLERIENLSRNARGFLEVGKLLQAMKCYETIVLIQPKNAAAVNNFGMCLKKMGKLDLAEKVLKRAQVLLKETEEEHETANK